MNGNRLKFFAIAKADNSFIVSSDTLEELQEKINQIRDKYRPYYQQYVAPGYYIVKAKDMKEAKLSREHVSFDLPLFTAANHEYQVALRDPVSLEMFPGKTYLSLTLALAFFQEYPDMHGEITERDGAGEVVRIYSDEEIKLLLQEQQQKPKGNKTSGQTELF